MDGEDVILRLSHRLATLNREKRFDGVNHVVVARTARYVDRGRWELEKDKIFRREPQLIGLSADIPEPGDYSAFDLAGQPVVAVRGPDGRARGFVNSCRHRGTAFAYGRSKAVGARFLCPYHHWC